MKQRKEVFAKSQGSTTGSLKSSASTMTSMGMGCNKCGGGGDDSTAASVTTNEPIYQGISDISVMRKDNEISSLKSNIAHLRLELAHAQKAIFSIKDNESLLREQLDQEKQKSHTLEKMATNNNKSSSSSNFMTSSTSCSSSSSTSGVFNSSMMDQRPANLVRRYGELYSQARLETLDSLDKLPQLVNAEELKNKLLFSVMVLAFRSVQSSMQNKRDQIRRILQLPPPPPSSTNGQTTSGSSTSPSTSGASSAGSGSDDEFVSSSTSELDIKTNSVIGKSYGTRAAAASGTGNGNTRDEDTESVVSVMFSNASVDPKAASDLEDAISLYLRRATENFDLSKNVEEVCSQIWATLYDYPCLKSCDAIIKYIKECVRVAWGLVNQVPSYVIEYENRHFRPDLHVRFHSSDAKFDQIRTYLWPALREGKDGPCVQKGVVIT